MSADTVGYFTHQCRFPLPPFDAVCCRAPKGFEDKFCREQRIWKELNCKKQCKLANKITFQPSCCVKDPTDLCWKFFGWPNYDCMPEKVFRENNKTMAALTNCMPKSCISRNCQGPYYSMKGPVYHPPGFICQDYSLYIPNELLLKHCKCRSNVSCLKKKKINPFLAKLRCCPQIQGDGIYQCGDCGCCYGPPFDFNWANYPVPCPDNNYNNAINDPCFNNDYNVPQDCNMNMNNMQQQGGPCYGGCGQPDSSNGPCQGQGQGQGNDPCQNEMMNNNNNQGNFNNQFQPFMFDVKLDDKGGKVTGAVLQMSNNQKNQNNQNQEGNVNSSCDCPTSTTVRQENIGNSKVYTGNHYPDCKCELCQRRRNGNFISPKITDKKGERCKQLWFGNYTEPICHKNATLASTLKELLDACPEEGAIPCTGQSDCPCAKCCKNRVYARIKPHHWNATGMDGNPDLKFQKPTNFMQHDENNNLTDESNYISEGQKGHTKVKFPDRPDQHKIDKNNNRQLLEDHKKEQEERDKLREKKGGGGGGLGVTSIKAGVGLAVTTMKHGVGHEDFQPKRRSLPDVDLGDDVAFNSGGNEHSFIEDRPTFEEKDLDAKGVCERENPMRKSFGLGVSIKPPTDPLYNKNRRPRCYNSQYWNPYCNCCCHSMCPDDWTSYGPMNYGQNNNFYDNNNCCQPCDPYPCDNNDNGNNGCAGENIGQPVRRKPRRFTVSKRSPKSQGDDGDNNNEAWSVMDDGLLCSEPNDYNTTTYRQNFEQCTPKPRGRSRARPVTIMPEPDNNNQGDDNCNTFNYPPDDEGWCNGKPRYRRGRKFNQDCEVYPTETNSFRIFGDLDKRIAESQKCEPDCPVRICNDRVCKVPLSIEIYQNHKNRKRCRDCCNCCDCCPEGIVCNLNSNMIDRYYNCCDD